MPLRASSNDDRWPRSPATPLRTSSDGLTQEARGSPYRSRDRPRNGNLGACWGSTTTRPGAPHRRDRSCRWRRSRARLRACPSRSRRQASHAGSPPARPVATMQPSAHDAVEHGDAARRRPLPDAPSGRDLLAKVGLTLQRPRYQSSRAPQSSSVSRVAPSSTYVRRYALAVAWASPDRSPLAACLTRTRHRRSRPSSRWLVRSWQPSASSCRGLSHPATAGTPSTGSSFRGCLPEIWAGWGCPGCSFEITFAGGLALLSRDSGRGGALVALAASIGVAIVTLMALGKINEGIGGNPLITSLAGGEVGGGVYVTIGGAVVAGVGALIGLAGPRPGPRAP